MSYNSKYKLCKNVMIPIKFTFLLEYSDLLISMTGKYSSGTAFPWPLLSIFLRLTGVSMSTMVKYICRICSCYY